MPTQYKVSHTGSNINEQGFVLDSHERKPQTLTTSVRRPPLCQSALDLCTIHSLTASVQPARALRVKGTAATSHSHLRIENHGGSSSRSSSLARQRQRRQDLDVS